MFVTHFFNIWIHPYPLSNLLGRKSNIYSSLLYFILIFKFTLVFLLYVLFVLKI